MPWSKHKVNRLAIGRSACVCVMGLEYDSTLTVRSRAKLTATVIATPMNLR